MEPNSGVSSPDDQSPPIPEKSHQYQRGLAARIFLSPVEPRLRAGWRMLGQIGIMLAVAIAISIALSLILAALAIIQPDILALDGTAESIVLGLSIIVALPAITISVWVARRALDRRSFTSLGLERRGLALRDLAVGFLIPAPLFALAFLLQWGLGWMEVDGWGWSGEHAALTILGVLLGLLGFLAVGFYEELLFRGYYLQNLREGSGLAIALFLSSAVFALAHIGNFAASLASTLGIFGAGYFLAFGYLRTRALWLPIGLHIGWNFFQGPIFGFAVSGNPMPSIIVQSVEGPELITGGSFGPEAGLLVLPMMAFGALLVWLYTRGRNTVTDQVPDS